MPQPARPRGSRSTTSSERQHYTVAKSKLCSQRGNGSTYAYARLHRSRMDWTAGETRKKEHVYVRREMDRKAQIQLQELKVRLGCSSFSVANHEPFRVATRGEDQNPERSHVRPASKITGFSTTDRQGLVGGRRQPSRVRGHMGGQRRAKEGGTITT